jgi:two-component system, LytTR family, response regulator
MDLAWRESLPLGPELSSLPASTLRTVIVDDEKPAREKLSILLASESDVKVIAECENGAAAIAALKNTKPDLLLLDISLPDMDGFAVLKTLPQQELPVVIFTTAYDQYALSAFEVHAIDYLLKPFSAERFAEALTRARERLAARDAMPVEALVNATRNKQTPLERVLIRDGSRVHVLPIDTIDYVEAQDDYVAFHADGKSYLKDQTLAAVEALLDPARFVRIHRSYLLNIERIARVELYAKDSRIAILRDGTKLPVSRAGYARLAKLL